MVKDIVSKKKRCDVDDRDARKDSSKMGRQEIGDFGYKAGMRTFKAERNWRLAHEDADLIDTYDEAYFAQKPGIQGYQTLEIHYQ